MLSRRDFLRQAALAGVGAQIAPYVATCSAAQSKRPNILFIFSDDHSIQTLGAYRSRLQNFIRTHNITPNLQQLAAEGATFTNSFVCNSICGPSRAAILTGKHSKVNGFYTNGQRFDGGQWTLPKALRKAGYQTAVFGKWHLNSTPTGFDVAEILPGQGNYYNPDFINLQGKRNREQGYCTEIISDKTINWLENQRDKDKPFFLCSWHKASHRTWMPEPKHMRLLDDVDVPEPDNLFDDYAGRSSAAKEQKMSIRNEINLATDTKVTPPFASSTREEIVAAAPKSASRDTSTFDEFERMTAAQRQAWDDYYVPRNRAFRAQGLSGDALVRWKYQAYLKDYIRCVKSLDDQIGRVLAYLKQSGLDQNTIVIYSSDQGFYNGEHGWYDKRWIYEESLRNPFIIKWPGVIKAGTTSDALIQNIDYAPTLLECAGVDVPAEIQGDSFKSILQGNTPKNWRDSILYTYYGLGAHAVKTHYGVRTQRYKLVHFPETDEWELYDIQDDPAEMHNLYGQAQLDNVTGLLKKELERLAAQYHLKL